MRLELQVGLSIIIRFHLDNMSEKSQMRLEEAAISLREQKKLDTKKLLIDTAFTLFEKRGFAATSVDEVARSAKVSRSTFFRYFDSKEGVVFATQEESGSGFVKALEARPPEEPALLAFERCLIELAEQSGEEDKRMALRFMRLLDESPQLRARYVQNLERWAQLIAKAMAERDGVAEPTEKHRLAASVGFLLVESANRDWHAAKGELDAPELVRGKFALLREIAATAT